MSESSGADQIKEAAKSLFTEIERSPTVMYIRSMTMLMLGVCLVMVGRSELPSGEFPSIPLLGDGWLSKAASSACVLALPIFYLSWVVLHFLIPVRLFAWVDRPFLIGGLIGIGGLFVGDQHWLQPWAWQAFLLLLIDLFYASVDDKRRWWMRLACSVYLFSAISKFDVAFIDNLGRVIVAKGFAPALGLDAAFWSPELKRLMAATMPVVELSAAVMLWTVRWRKLGLYLATAMHVGLLLALGPLGLDHHPGVLIWNVFFVLHVWVLFWKSSERLWRRDHSIRHAAGEREASALAKLDDGSVERTSDDAVATDAVASDDVVQSADQVNLRDRGSSETRPPGMVELACRDGGLGLRGIFLTVMLLLPVGEPFGLFDHWPGWSVYSNRPPIVRLEVAFPEPVTGVDWVGAPQPLTNLQIVSLSGWSYATWRTPAYPQERFQLAVIDALLEKLPVDTRFRVRLKRFDPWRTGRAEEAVYETRAELAERLSEFWLPTESTDWQLPEAIRRTLPDAAD